MAENSAPVKSSAGETYERAHAPNRRGLTLHDVVERLWSGRGPVSEDEWLEGLDAVKAHKLGLEGGSQYRLMVDAEQAVAKGGDLSGLSDDELLDRVAQAEPAAIAEFRLRRGRAQAAEAQRKAAQTPEERAAELAAKSEDELYQLALTDPGARTELQRRHTEETQG